MSHDPLNRGEGLRDRGAGNGDKPDYAERFRRRVLSYLAGRYHPILCRALAYWRVQPTEMHEDLVQEFFCQKLVIEDLIAAQDRCKGRLRTLILAAFRRFVLNAVRDRKPTLIPKQNESIDEVDERLVLSHDPGRRMDLHWAAGVLEESLVRCQVWCWENNEARMWRLIELRIIGPVYYHQESPPLEDVAALLGFRDEKHVSREMRRAKNALARQLTAVIRESGLVEGGIEAAIRDLRTICEGSVRYRS